MFLQAETIRYLRLASSHKAATIFIHSTAPAGMSSAQSGATVNMRV
jgi:hypothetical protein